MSRCLLATLAIALSASPAFALEFLTGIYPVFDAGPTPYVFTFSAAANAKLVASFTTSTCCDNTQEFPARATADLSRLTDALTNGTLDTLSFDFNGQLQTAPESLFSTNGGTPINRAAEFPFPNGIDMQGWVIDHYSVGLALPDSPHPRIVLSIYGSLPEPSSWILAMMGVVALGAIARR